VPPGDELTDRDIFSDCNELLLPRRRRLILGTRGPRSPARHRDRGQEQTRSPARISAVLADGSAMARATGVRPGGGRRPSHGRPGCGDRDLDQSANTRLARSTVPWDRRCRSPGRWHRRLLPLALGGGKALHPAGILDCIAGLREHRGDERQLDLAPGRPGRSLESDTATHGCDRRR